MSRNAQLREHHRAKGCTQRRLAIAGALCALAAVVLLAQMIRLQVVEHHHYATLSQENRVKVEPIPPTRGLIYDRNGTLLAENQPSYQLVITPERLEGVARTLNRIDGIVELTEAQRRRFRQRLETARHFEEVPLRTHLTQREVAEVAVNRHRFPSLEVQARLVRHYPQGEIAAHALGHVGRINEQDLRRIDAAAYRGTDYIGKSGIELAYEEVLHGEPGFKRVETNALGRVIRTMERQAPRPGDDLILTLDSGLQRVAERALGEQAGALVALQPGSGEILAMVSHPDYNPELFIEGMTTERFAKLAEQGQQPLFNRAVQGVYPPASTIKPFIGLGALEHGVVTPRATVECDGEYHLEGRDRPYRCWRRWGHGEVDYRRAIAESCNVYFYDTAFRMGIDRISGFLEPFGFGAETGLELLGERSGVLPSRAWKRRAIGEGWYHGETVLTGIGLGYFSATPLQLAKATATLANRGRVVQPQLVRTIRDSIDGSESRAAATVPQQRIELDDPRHWEVTVDAMRRAVEDPSGTAHRIAEGLDYTIAAKTGTAQITGLAEHRDDQPEERPRRLRDHALFIGFAPADEPEIAVAVVVEHGGSGGAKAAPIARSVFDAWLRDDRSYLQALEARRRRAEGGREASSG
ncbi:penicillin-binding protein 2 [Halorhodospira neutriphila]|uniref:penicillin-binding protein 2 n=1 Tax=Halorhodospira neutriphila TaxID=168379 RepID=UPI0030844024